MKPLALITKDVWAISFKSLIIKKTKVKYTFNVTILFRFLLYFPWLPYPWLTMPQPHPMPQDPLTRSPNRKITLPLMNIPILSKMTMLVSTLVKMKNEMVMLPVANTMLLFQIVVSKL